MERIAIIGASGEVGFRLVQRLCSRYQVVAIVRRSGKRDFEGLGQIDVRVVADIDHIPALTAALDGCDAVVNAGYIWFAQSINEAMERCATPPRHVIFTGSTGIFTRLPSESAERKRLAEAYIRQHLSCRWTIIRPTMIYGHKDDRNISRLVRAVDRLRIFPLIGNGESLIQPVFIHDLVKAYEMALLNERCYDRSYNVAGGRPYSNRDLIRCAANSLGKKTFFIPVPAPLVGFAVRLLGSLRLSPISSEQVLRFQENKDIDLHPFIDEFKYVPRDFEHGIGELVHDMRRHGLLR
ncbi:NAD-dependent epimerase/dehydratase family protein [Noviherbaspirillum aerium]|uniref:NAD-dependent epimerase/dehydratase family protein n=1 Tax=Noviherbaspirillum aerium TaxID=2588497 RepID=UPI00178C32A3|nr:NAD(P)H-binding protein [Noviherbaspirillum aerium]